MKVLRWILVIPAAILGWFLGFALQMVTTAFVGAITGKITFIITRLAAAFIAGIASQYAATAIAPNGKKIASVLGAIVMVPILLYSSFYKVSEYGWTKEVILPLIEYGLTFASIVVCCIMFLADKDNRTS
jgi:hypothetical protein